MTVASAYDATGSVTDTFGTTVAPATDRLREPAESAGTVAGSQDPMATLLAPVDETGDDPVSPFVARG